MLQFIWQYPDTVSSAKVEWFSRILKDNYQLKAHFEPHRASLHKLRHINQPGSIIFHGSRETPLDNPWWEPLEIQMDTPLVAPKLPVIKGGFLDDGGYERWLSSDSIELGVDLFETVFSALSGEAELNRPERQNYLRSSAQESRAYKYGYLNRPYVDEYMEVLWAYIKRIWPDIDRLKRNGSIRYSCDVDTPFDPAASGLIEFTKRFSADIILRKSIPSVIGRCRNVWNNLNGQFEQDTNYQFSFIIDQLKLRKQKAVFYFLSTLEKGKGRGWYSIADPKIQLLLKNIHDAGHEIGLHGSFGSHASFKQYKQELDLLKQICAEARIHSPIIRNRQHFLRFDLKQTPDLLEDCGIAYDSSGGFAEEAGFRFGTAIPFPMWSWQKNQGLKLIQEPLICMECSLLASKYMNLPHYPKAFEYASTLKKRALAYGGDFNLLWHNSELKTAHDRKLFCDLLHTD